MRAQSDDHQDPRAAGEAASGVVGDLASERVLAADGYAREGPGADARARRAAPGIPVSRCAAVVKEAPVRRASPSWSTAHRHADGENGHCGAVPQAQYEQAASAHKVYPYLLRHLAIERTNQVWATDITYVPMPQGFMYLAAVMDWATRRVLAWRVSNTMTADFCVEAVEEAIGRYGKPEIFNTDQGTQFTSDDFTTMLQATAWRSAWTAAAAGATTYSWSDCGARSSTKRLPARLRECQRGQSRCRAISGFLRSTTPAHRAGRPNSRRGILHPTNLKERSLKEIRVTRWRPARGFPPPQEIHLRNAEICLN